jgi:hypothetical protein
MRLIHCRSRRQIIAEYVQILRLAVCIATLGCGAALAEEVPLHGSHAAMVTEIDLQDLIAFAKVCVWVGGIFILLLTGLGIAFFGFDVRSAHRRISEDTKEVGAFIAGVRELQDKTRDSVIQSEDRARSILKDLEDLVSKQRETQAKAVDVQTEFFSKLKRDVEESLRGIQEQVEQAGAEVQELIEKTDKSDSHVDRRRGRSDEDLIREVISTSKFEWTTLGRIMTATGLPKDKLMEIARRMEDIWISRGAKTRDAIFKFKTDKKDGGD